MRRLVAFSLSLILFLSFFVGIDTQVVRFMRVLNFFLKFFFLLIQLIFEVSLLHVRMLLVNLLDTFYRICLQ